MTQKQPLIIGNWKNVLGVGDSVRLVQALMVELQNANHVEVVVAPSALALLSVAEIVRDTRMGVAIQTIGTEAACTGEVSAEQAREAGATYAIIGHSERRVQYGEDDDMVARKIGEAMKAQLVPILCVGETRAERKANRIRTVLKRQISHGLRTLKASTPLVIAYEPVWAIGAKKAATAKVVAEAHDMIHAMLGRSARIVYGGSVDQESALTLARLPFVDGFLVGRASLDVAAFHGIIQAYIER